MDSHCAVYRHGLWLVASGQWQSSTDASKPWKSAVSGNGDTAEKLTVLGTNLETIMENQKQLLDLRDRIAEVEKTTVENDLLVQTV